MAAIILNGTEDRPLILTCFTLLQAALAILLWVRFIRIVQAYSHSRDLAFCGMSGDSRTPARLFWCARFNCEEDHMRIICDHCSGPIFGAVKRLAGNFNLHPDCLALLGKEPTPGSNIVRSPSREPAISSLVEWQGRVMGISREVD